MDRRILLLPKPASISKVTPVYLSEVEPSILCVLDKLREFIWYTVGYVHPTGSQSRVYVGLRSSARVCLITSFVSVLPPYEHEHWLA